MQKRELYKNFISFLKKGSLINILWKILYGMEDIRDIFALDMEDLDAISAGADVSCNRMNFRIFKFLIFLLVHPRHLHHTENQKHIKIIIF